MSIVATSDLRIKILIDLFGSFNTAIDAGDFSSGGSNKQLNYDIFKIAQRIKSGFISVEDDDNFRDFYAFALKYNNGVINTFWLGDEISHWTTKKEEVPGNSLFKDYPEFTLNLLAKRVESFILKDGKLEKQIIKASKTQFDQISDEIFTLILENKFEELVDNEVVSYILENGFNFGNFQDKISESVSDILSDKDGQGFDFQIPKWAYDKYIHLQNIEKDGGVAFRLSDELYPSGEPKTIKSPKLSQAQVIIDGVEGLRSAQGFNQKTDQIVWPDVAITNLNGDLIEEAVEEVASFQNFAGTEIAEYPFKFYKSIREDFSFIKSPIAALTQFFRGGDDELFSTKNVISSSLKHAYSKVFLSILEDLSDDNNIEQTVGRTFNNFYSSEDGIALVNKIATYILIDKEIVRRKTFWDFLSDAEEDDGKIDAEEQEEALTAALDAWAAGTPPERKDELSKEDIQNRQKFFKQCALMMNLPSLKNGYDKVLKEKYDKKHLFDDRFYMIYCQSGGQEKLLSNLLTSANEQKLLEIPTHVLSSLVPKIRLFKVREKGDKITNTEFIFDSTSQIDRKSGGSKGRISPATSFLSAEFDKGAGCGLKEFSFEFNGTNPAEARNDIKASLKLYFQSFNDFIRYRTGEDGSTYRFVDLIIQPKQDETTIEIISERQYEPSFYRIRADVGYYTDGIEDTDLRNAIEVSNKTLFLNMVDHDIQFKNDGSVEISISYRAYLESLLKHPRLDALASPELIARRQKNARLLSEELAKKRCTKERIKELQISIAATEEVILKRSLSSIVDRLRNRGAIYSVQINEEDRKHFLSKGYFKKCRLKTQISDLSNSVDKGKNNADVGVVLSSKLPQNSGDFNFLNASNNVVQFFFFGDLLYTVLDCIYKEGGKLRENVFFNNSKVLLGSFEFDPFQIANPNDRVFNIAHIPISVDFFSRWFVDEVMAQKTTRKTFPVLNFIRNLTNQLIKPSLLETCVNRSVDKTLRFQTSQVTAYHPNEERKDPLNKHNVINKGKIGMEVMSLREGKNPTLPLKGGGSNNNPNNLFNYIVLSTAGSSLSYSGSGNYGTDIKEGRLHVNIGQNNGLVKSISLSKSDQQYIREARFFQQGIDGLLQLSAVYVANLEMFGNTLFYPGMEFFFNPYGLGGATGFGSPTIRDSVANKLGIGGYHTITSVRSSITPGSFKTTIAGQQYYSGYGSGNPNLRGKNSENKGVDSLENYVPEKIDDDACETVILGVVRFESDEIELDNDNIEAEVPEARLEESDNTSETIVETEPLESELTEEDLFPTSEQE